ncbi:MAG TPA: MFS transporter [Negativicutes bacterium]|nr:MFS transporter [Negativicutes bacterium]
MTETSGETTGQLTGAPTAAAPPGEKIANNYFDGLPLTPFHKVLYFIIMLAYFFEQMDNWNFGFIAPQLVKTWGLTMADIGRINFFYFISMTAGGLSGGFISDIIGRRRTFLGAILIFSLASLANGITSDLTIFIIARSLTGFGIFCLMVCSQAYIAEISPAESRGKWQGLIAAVGFSAVPVIGALCRVIIPLGPEAWRIIFLLGGLGLIGFVLGLKYLQESPRWLVAHKRLPEAERIVETISGVKVDLREAAAKVEQKESILDTLIGMFTAKYIKRTLVLATFVLLTTPPAFVIFAWTPMLLTKRGLSIEDSLMASFILMVGVPVGCYIASLISDKGGRKIPLCIATVLGAGAALVFSQVTGFLPVVIVGFCLVAGVMCLSFISFSYIAESYPTRMRNTAVGIHNASGRFATSFMQLMVPVIFAQAGFVGVYGVVAAMLILPVIVVMLWGMRTGGKALEEIS